MSIPEQANLTGESMEENDAAIPESADAICDLIAEVAAWQVVLWLAGECGLVEAALDIALASLQLLA